MTLLIRSTLLGTLAIAALLAAIFIVKAVVALATVLLAGIIALYLMRRVVALRHRLAARGDLATFRRG